MDTNFFEFNPRSFKVHLTNLKYMVFDYMCERNLADDCSLIESNIIREGRQLIANARQRMNNGESTNSSEEFHELLFGKINKILAAYILQCEREGFPVTREEKIVHWRKYEMAAHLSTVLESMFQRGRRPRDRIGYRRYQVHPVNQNRKLHGFFETYIPTLAEYDEKFKNFTRMSRKQFRFLLHSIGPTLQKSDKFRKDTISPACRILITLNYLSQGEDFCDLATFYEVASCTVRGIVNETCKVIWDMLQPIYIVFPGDFELESEKWNNLRFPHCFGAVDGKHVRIEKPKRTGSEYRNYRKFFLIILMGICDSEKNFIFTAIGAPGSFSDSDVWSNCDVGVAFQTESFQLPAPSALPHSDVNFGHFLIGDNAFPLTKRFMKPYSRRNGAALTVKEQNFNKVLSSARNTIESTFGILANRFKIFRGEIRTDPQFATDITKAAVVLHNYIRKTSDENTPKITMNESDNLISDNPRGFAGRPSREAMRLRDKYKDYLWDHKPHAI